MILISQHQAKNPFAGQNTQELSYFQSKNIFCFSWISNGLKLTILTLGKVYLLFCLSLKVEHGGKLDQGKAHIPTASLLRYKAALLQSRT